jgi:flagellar protein FliO/FliZ
MIANPRYISSGFGLRAEAGRTGKKTRERSSPRRTRGMSVLGDNDERNAGVARVTTSMDILSWLFFIALIGGLIVVGGLLLRGYLTGSPTGGLSDALKGGLFGPKPEKRLEVVDQANVDGRRRLVLIRRDDVEHLIMTGGPVDVVIETGISQRSSQKSAEVVGAPAALYSRPARPLGQAVGEQ